MREAKYLNLGLYAAIFIGLLHLGAPNSSLAQVNPCAAKNPCAANPCAANPCAAKNPCSANPCSANPCSAAARAASPMAKAITATGKIISVDPGARRLVIAYNGSRINLTLGKHSVVRQGPTVKTARQIRPGDKATVSYVDNGRARTAWYIYLASASSVANPCGGNPCAARNPCAANPCGARNPCSAKNPCAANPCAARNPCGAR